MLMVIISLISTVYVGYGAIKSLFNKKISVDLLASFALIVSELNGEWESATFISLMILSAKIFSVYTDSKARSSIQSLLKLKPKTIKIKDNGKIIEIPLEQVKKNQTIVVENGDRLAVDGTVISGFASIDQSSLTGESLPVAKKKGDQVFSSTLNISGTLFVNSDKVGKDTNFEKIIHLMEEAQNQKIGMKSMVDSFTTWYIVATAFVAVLIYLATHNISVVLSLLLVTCADDIAVAIPLTYMAGIARAASRGVIIKGGIYLEALDKVRTIIVDKTGTLTNGQIKVLHLIPFNNFHPSTVIQISSSLASTSSHPISKAINAYGNEHHFVQVNFDKYQEVPGKGVTARNNHDHFLLGNLKFIQEKKISINSVQLSQIKRIESEGHNIVLIAKNNQLIGLIGLGDNLRLGVKTAIEKIKNNGVKNIIMLTGDNQDVAKDISSQIGITQYFASLLPIDKLKYIKKYQGPPLVAFVGDGVNDTAAIAQADVGIAMGGIGSDAAIETADITLMDDNFNKINETIELSHHVSKIVKEDFAIWALVNFVGLLLVFIFNIPPKTAAAYNFITDFLPLLNSIRLFRPINRY